MCEFSQKTIVFVLTTIKKRIIFLAYSEAKNWGFLQFYAKNSVQSPNHLINSTVKIRIEKIRIKNYNYRYSNRFYIRCNY